LTEAGPVAVIGTLLATGRVDVPRFDREALNTALRTIRPCRIRFPEFLMATWRAGIVRYDVDFRADMHVFRR
jgi:uncharacterized protein YbcV (DUF1398 family)